MTLPTVTVTGHFQPRPDAPARGRITFQLTTPMVDANDEVIVSDDPIAVPLTAGQFSVNLVPSDAAGLTPTPVPYMVTEEFGSRRSYYVTIPSGQSTVDLSSLVSVGDPPVVANLLAAETTRAESAEQALATSIAAKIAKSGDTMTGPLTLPSAPTAPLHAATKDYVDSSAAQSSTATALTAEIARAQAAEAAISAGLQFKAARVVATSNIASRSGLQTVDDVSLGANDLVLLIAQTPASQNGLWKAASGAWTRPGNYATGSDATAVSVWIEDGTGGKSSIWVVAGSPPNVVDANAVTFQQASGLGEVIAGTGIVKTGNTLSTDPAVVATVAALVGKAQALTRTSVKTANYTAAPGDLVPVDTTSAAVTVTLPNAPAVGSRIAVKLVALGAGHAVTLACAGSDVFNKTGGATAATLTLLNQAVQVQYDTGGIWTVVADDLPKSALDATYAPLNVASPSVTDGNAVQLTGCTLTNGSAAATFAGASLNSGDVGKSVVAVHGNDYLVTTIAAVTSSTGATLAAPWAGATTSGAQVTYGNDRAAEINSNLAAVGALGGGKVTISSPSLCLSTLAVPDNVALVGLGFSGRSTIYAGHYGNIVQSTLWGQVGTAQNQFCDCYDVTLVGLLPASPPAFAAKDSPGAGTYLFTTVQLAAGTLSQTFTSGGAFPVSGNLDSRWPAGSVGSPVYFWHNNICFNYTSTTPFATTNITDGSVASVTILTHGFVYPLNSQGHGVAFQSFRGKLERIRTYNTVGDGVRVQGSGTADPTAYGHKITWIRAESPGWVGVELGEATTDDFADVISVTKPGVVGFLSMGGDPTVRTVHTVNEPTRPWVPSVVLCGTNESVRDVILDTCYGPGIVLDGGLTFRGVGPSETRIDGLRYLGSANKAGHGIPLLAKTRAVTINADHLGIAGVTFDQSCAFLFAHGPQTQVANGANVTLSTTPSSLPVLDATAFDPMGGSVSTTHSGSTRTTTYTGVAINATRTNGSQQTVTIGSGGTLNLEGALPTAPTSGDWYIIGGQIAVQVSVTDTGGNTLKFGNSVSLYGLSGAQNMPGNSFVSRQALTGCTLASGTQTMAVGDAVVQATLQAGKVQGSIDAPGVTGPTLPVSQAPISVKATDSMLLTTASQIGTGLGVVGAGPLYGFGTVIVASGAATGQVAHGLSVRSGVTPVVDVTPASIAGISSGTVIAATADGTNVTVSLSAVTTAQVTFNYIVRATP